MNADYLMETPITEEDIREQIRLAEKSENEDFSIERSYEDGVIDTLYWILGEMEEPFK